MILLDTDVLSAVMAPSPPAAVVDWLNRQESHRLFLSTVTLAEIGFGLWILPGGKKKRRLEERFESFVAVAFEHRTVSFDAAAAREYPSIMGTRRRDGRPMAIADGQIAAIARARRLAIATRNVRDFEGAGVEIIDPFEVAGS